MTLTRTALSRRTPPKRKSRLRPVSARRSAQRVQRAGVRVIVWLRADRRCEACGVPLGIAEMEPSHRQAASQGGPYTPVNIMSLCSACHRTGRNAIHRRPKGEALRRGLRLLSTQDPATVPVRLWDGRLVTLTADGEYEEAV